MWLNPNKPMLDPLLRNMEGASDVPLTWQKGPDFDGFAQAGVGMHQWSVVTERLGCVTQHLT